MHCLVVIRIALQVIQQVQTAQQTPVRTALLFQQTPQPVQVRGVELQIIQLTPLQIVPTAEIQLGQVSLRARSRQAVFRVESDDDSDGNDNVGWRLGATRLDIKPDGRR